MRRDALHVADVWPPMERRLLEVGPMRKKSEAPQPSQAITRPEITRVRPSSGSLRRKEGSRRPHAVREPVTADLSRDPRREE